MTLSLGNRLRGKAVLLSASVPNRAEVATKLYSGALPKLPDEDLRVEIAVTALARAVFREAGQLVFGGHPAISPHVAMIAAEYFNPTKETEETACDGDTLYPEPILVFQSEAYREVITSDVRLMRELGQARICWTRAVADEKFDPMKRGSEQCPRSLKLMREQMCARVNLVAMACIGGMDGIFDELQIFQRHPGAKRSYVFASTGGASTVIPGLRLPYDIAVPDENQVLFPWDFSTYRVPPYDDIVQQIIDDIAPDDVTEALPHDEVQPSE